MADTELGSSHSATSPLPSTKSSFRSRTSWRWSALAAFALIAGATAYFLTKSPSKTQALNTSSGGAVAPSPIGSGYLKTDSSEVAFIQWNDLDGHVKGAMQDTAATGTPPNVSVATKSVAVAGTITGSAISLSFEGLSPAFGTWAGNSFTINVPQGNGTLLPITFKTSSASAYNSAVQVLTKSIVRENNRVAAASAIQQEQQSILSAGQTVKSDFATFQQDLDSLSTALVPLTSDLKHEETDLVTTASAAASAERQPGNSTCDPAVAAQNDADTVQNDTDNIGSDSDNIETAIQSLRNDVSQIQTDYPPLANAEMALPNYGNNLPQPSSVDRAKQIALQAIGTALQRTNAAIDKANSLDTSATQDAQSALQAENCGDAPSPALVQKIS